jgi:aryl-alcohol dehydrogenase-like predicted oxidoreductase
MLVTNQQRDSEMEIIDRVEALAKKKGVSMAIIATAWILSKDGISTLKDLLTSSCVGPDRWIELG